MFACVDFDVKMRLASFYNKKTSAVISKTFLCNKNTKYSSFPRVNVKNNNFVVKITKQFSYDFVCENCTAITVRFMLSN